MRKTSPLSIAPRRQIMVIDDQLVPGIEFTQAAKSGNVLILFWTIKGDRLYRWDGRWTPIKPETISATKKRFLSETNYR